jgi:phosphosulfolactate synthase (CoM biosynthesis protein A)
MNKIIYFYKWLTFSVMTAKIATHASIARDVKIALVVGGALIVSSVKIATVPEILKTAWVVGIVKIVKTAGAVKGRQERKEFTM